METDIWLRRAKGSAVFPEASGQAVISLRSVRTLSPKLSPAAEAFGEGLISGARAPWKVFFVRGNNRNEVEPMSPTKEHE